MSNTSQGDKANLIRVSPTFTSIGVYVDVESSKDADLLNDIHTFSDMAASVIASIGELHQIVEPVPGAPDLEIRIPRSALQAAYVTELLLALSTSLLEASISRSADARAREENLSRENATLRAELALGRRAA